MAISLYKADELTHLEWFKKTASTTYTFNDLVTIDTTGYLIKSVDGSTLTVIGLIQRTIAATASDYASNTKVPVLVPGPNAVFLCDVSTGTAAAEDVGQWIDIDDHNSVDVDASTYGIFQIVGIVSSTQVLAKLAKKSGPLGT